MNNQITITKDEAALVLALISLYEAAWLDANHRPSCLCRFCEALNRSGDFDYKTFQSLEEKCK